MAPVIQLDPGFAFAGLATPEKAPAPDVPAAPTTGDPLGALAALAGTWTGNGFNAIWRPHNPFQPQDRFLELNLTTETIVFTPINGPIPNRGLAMPDIEMFGLTYLQQISETSTGAGLHIEPGIWANVPQTTDPSEPPSVVRMASIPHGTVVLAQGESQVVSGGPPQIPETNLLPFGIGGQSLPNSDFNSVAQGFPELILSQSTSFRSASPGVTQAMVENPNSVLVTALNKSLTGTTMKSRTFLQVSTSHNRLTAGGGTANTAFLRSSVTPPGGNARAVEVFATFWIEDIAGTGGQPDTQQLQYSQLVLLDFNGLSWPHVTVSTLVKQ